MTLAYFVRDCLRELVRGGWRYWSWVGFLLALIAFGAWHYLEQLSQGLVITHMTNQVSWGFYIANFTFLVGVAAAAVMLAIPAYLFNRRDIKDVVLMGDTMAIAAVTMAILFVVADLGRPDRLWHLIPGIGRFHFPQSMLAWDVLVLSGYLLLNFGISFYVIFCHYRNCEPKRLLLPGVSSPSSGPSRFTPSPPSSIRRIPVDPSGSTRCWRRGSSPPPSARAGLMILGCRWCAR